MQINLMKSTAEPTYLDKGADDYLESVGIVEGTLREETNLITPSILLQWDYATTPFNYIYIPAFSRFYFVTNITSANNQLWRVDLKVDVLETYKTQIKNLNAIIDRNEYDFDPYLNDDMEVFNEGVDVQVVSMMDNEIFTPPEVEHIVDTSSGINEWVFNSDGRYVVTTSVTNKKRLKMLTITLTSLLTNYSVVGQRTKFISTDDILGSVTFTATANVGYVFTDLFNIRGNAIARLSLSSDRKTATITLSNITTSCLVTLNTIGG